MGVNYHRIAGGGDDRVSDGERGDASGSGVDGDSLECVSATGVLAGSEQADGRRDDTCLHAFKPAGNRYLLFGCKVRGLNRTEEMWKLPLAFAIQIENFMHYLRDRPSRGASTSQPKVSSSFQSKRLGFNLPLLFASQWKINERFGKKKVAG
jgi:hypothetical protein